MMTFITLGPVLLLILEDFLLWIFIRRQFINHRKALPGELPRVTVFVPARNEEARLPACLEALAALDYPEDKIQMIVADDQSNDQTPRIMREWVGKHSYRHFIQIQPGNMRGINGKANALSQMDKAATGEFYFFTDADSAVNPGWIREMLAVFDRGVGLASGITAVRAGAFFATMQSIDWWLNLGIVKVTSDLGHSLTAMGNNMVVSKQAYWAVGGFGNLPFSVTEDLALGQAILQKGFRLVQQVSVPSLILTKPENNLKDLLRQRKRWMRGAMSLPWYWLLLLALQFAFFPAVILLLTHMPLWGLVLWPVKWIVQSMFIRDFAARTGSRVSFLHLFWFEFYYLAVSWSTLFYYIWPSKTEWKGRKYHGIYR